MHAILTNFWQGTVPLPQTPFPVFLSLIPKFFIFLHTFCPSHNFYIVFYKL